MNHKGAALTRMRTVRIVIAGVAVGIFWVGWTLLGPTSVGSPSVHAGDVYRSGGGPPSSGVARHALGGQPTITTYETIADLLRAALIAAGPPTSLIPRTISPEGIVDPGEPYFVWEPANGWFTLHDAGAPGLEPPPTITRVEVLLGSYFANGSTDVLVQIDGLTYAAIDYRIDGATMRKIADLLYPPTTGTISLGALGLA